MPGRNSQISRIYAIMSLLDVAPQGLSAGELTDRLNGLGHEASQRTVYRDLEALNQAGFPLFPEERATDTSATRWKLEKLTRITEHFILSSKELLALYLSRGCLAPLRDTPFYADLDTLFAKIEARLATKSQEYFESLRSELKFEPGPRWGLGLDPDIVETIRAACSERQVLSIVHQSAGTQEKKRRRVGPHCLYFAKGSLYLVGEDLDKKANRIFSVPRVSEAEMLDEAYAGADFDPEAFFQSSFGIFRGEAPLKIRIAFSPLISPYIKERSWHSTQSVVSKGDGSTILQLEVALTPELVQWVLGFGPEARVLEPEALKEAVKLAASKVAALYAA